MGRFFEEFRMGEVLHTGGRTVTETDIVLFSTQTGAHNPMFLNEEYAKKTPFGGRIAPGMLTLSISTALTYQTGVLEGTLIALQSLDSIRFPAPVRPGDTLAMDLEVVGLEDDAAKKRGLVKMRGTARNQKGEAVLEAQWNFLMRRKAT
ncbi:MAG: MaoC family dehydratase N-terminal domain-containing protein [Euryarchaeota archaeon]|nr:MaoC family dehydratase N-terminal domain-containing protein [Euryarchaeota archaeon]